jgi:hypothetical protein
MSVISFYFFLVLTIIFVILTIKNSIGNVTYILAQLDSSTYNKEELVANYNQLADKWGEWELIGISVRYIDIGNALFSGLMVTFCTLMFVSFGLAFLLGKIIFPTLRKYYENNNDEMVDLATLKSATQIDELSKRKEWF